MYDLSFLMLTPLLVNVTNHCDAICVTVDDRHSWDLHTTPHWYQRLGSTSSWNNGPRTRGKVRCTLQSVFYSFLCTYSFHFSIYYSFHSFIFPFSLCPHSILTQSPFHSHCPYSILPQSLSSLLLTHGRSTFINCSLKAILSRV